MLDQSLSSLILTKPRMQGKKGQREYENSSQSIDDCSHSNVKMLYMREKLNCSNQESNIT
jgi:hypothetical protein